MVRSGDARALKKLPFHSLGKVQLPQDMKQYLDTFSDIQLQAALLSVVRPISILQAAHTITTTSPEALRKSRLQAVIFTKKHFTTVLC